MFNQRTDPRYLAIRRMVREGEIGTVHRINWIITDWFRTDAYYNSGSWRATWKGEGGGLIVNQLPHNLDLLQWIFGMPSSVRASCLFGHHHAIEVEDEVNAILDYPDGASAVIVSSTGESPGTNRLEVAGDLGKLVLEGDRLTIHRNAVSMREFSRTSKECFAKPPCSVEVIEFPDRGGDQHVAILRNFTAAVLHGEPLIAPATEGIHSVELGNAMLLSSINDMTVRLPINVQDFDNCLNALIEHH
jgi:predicted dehydrogenase